MLCWRDRSASSLQKGPSPCISRRTVHCVNCDVSTTVREKIYCILTAGQATTVSNFKMMYCIMRLSVKTRRVLSWLYSVCVKVEAPVSNAMLQSCCSVLIYVLLASRQGSIPSGPRTASIVLQSRHLDCLEVGFLLPQHTDFVVTDSTRDHWSQRDIPRVLYCLEMTMASLMYDRRLQSAALQEAK